MDLFRACLKKIRACPFSKATGPGLVHEKMFAVRGSAVHKNHSPTLYIYRVISP